MRTISLLDTVARDRAVNRLPDTLKLKLGLERLGYYRWGERSAPGADDDLWSGLERYQAARGLEVDGVAMPNGPTMTALNGDLARAPGHGSLIGARPLDAELPYEVFTANRRMARSLARSTAVGDLPTFMVSALKSDEPTAPAEVADLIARTHEIAPQQAGRLRAALDEYLDEDDGRRFDDNLRARIGPTWDDAARATEEEPVGRAEDVALAEQDEGDKDEQTAQSRPSYDPKQRVDVTGGTLTPEYRDEIAHAERNQKGYEEVNPGKAWGRYQMTDVGLQAAGMKDANNRWTGKYGVHSEQDFLNNPEAQERAFEDYTRKNDGGLRANGAKAHVGQHIDGIRGSITISEGGLAAAAHREGPTGVRRYLDRLQRNDWKSDINTMPENTPKEKREKDRFYNVETRLREFQRVSPRK